MTKINWTPIKKKKLIEIKRGQHKNNLEILARRWNIDYKSIYNKWYYLQGKNNQSDEQIYVIDKEIKVPQRKERPEVIRMKASLISVIDKLEVNNGSISIPSCVVHNARKLLVEKYPDRRFMFSPSYSNGEKTRFVRIFRKF